MATEVFSGGYAVEYICRVVDETNGKESVPETATMAEMNLNSVKTSGDGGKKGAEEASKSKTGAVLNTSLQVATPVLNGLTDGVAGQVIGKGKQIINAGKAIASGAGKAAIFGAIAPFIIAAVSKTVQEVQNTRARNDAIAQSLDNTNLRRQMAGLENINYTQSRVFKTVRLEEKR